MIEVADNQDKKVLDKHAVVYEHLSNLYEKQWLEIYGKLTHDKRVLIFNKAFSELIAMAQGDYLDDYYQRIKKDAI